MSDHIVGIMWARNEADIVEETITDGLRHVDTLMIAEDGSTDRTWDIIQSLAKEYPQIEHIQQKPTPGDPAQREALLNEVRRRYRPEDTWVMALESDLLILDTDIRAALAQYARHDLAMTWILLNGVRPVGTWLGPDGVDTYPNWGDQSIREVLPLAHYMEIMASTFRPLPKLHYVASPWRPWPLGFSSYTSKPVKVRPRGENAPLLFHAGYRGPTHFHRKYASHGKRHRRYHSWRTDSPENANRTVPYFNGTYSDKAFPASREGWLGRKGTV